MPIYKKNICQFTKMLTLCMSVNCLPASKVTKNMCVVQKFFEKKHPKAVDGLNRPGNSPGKFSGLVDREIDRETLIGKF